MCDTSQGPAQVRTPEEREEDQRKARCDIRTALWEGTNYLGWNAWHSYVWQVINEIDSDWD